MSELVVFEGKEIYTTSLIISDNLNIKHDSIMKMLKKYSHIENLSGFEIQKVKTKGRNLQIALLTEERALILVSMMKNTPEVISFKISLVKAFIKYRKIAQKLSVQKQNEEWLLHRHESKYIRKECTDVIKEFVEYAVKQGSKSAAKYYANLSKIELRSLFLLEQKYPNAREIMNMKQLSLIKMADEAIKDTLVNEMEKGTHYKDIYKLAKEKIEALAKIFPPSPLPSMHDNSIVKK